MYANWRFMMWSAGVGSYREIDAAVEAGTIQPGWSSDQCKKAMGMTSPLACEKRSGE